MIDVKVHFKLRVIIKQFFNMAVNSRFSFVVILLVSDVFRPGVRQPKTWDGDLRRRPRQKYPIPGIEIEKTTQNWANCYDNIPKTGEFL